MVATQPVYRTLPLIRNIMRHATRSSPERSVTGECTVEELLTRFPATASVFHELGCDTCSHAQTTLRQAATVARTDLSVVLSMLEASAHESFAGGRSAAT